MNSLCTQSVPGVTRSRTANQSGVSRFLSRLSTALTLLFVSGFLALPAWAAEFNLRMQMHLSPGDPGYKSIEKDFVQSIRDMSGGRVEIELFPVDSLYPVKEGLDAVSLGIVDIGMHTGFYFAGQMGGIASIETGLPGAETGPLERYGFFYEEGFIDIVREAYAEQGVYYLAPILSTSWGLVSKVPLRTAADFEGKKIRAGGVEAEWFRSLGAEPVFLSGAEVYTALATGVVDAVRWGAADENLIKGFHEVAGYYIQPATIPAPNNHILINPAVWESLPADIQRVMETAAKSASLHRVAQSESSVAVAQKKLVEEFGVEVITIPADEWRIMTQKARAIWEKHGEDSEHARKAVDLLKEYVRKLNR